MVVGVLTGLPLEDSIFMPSRAASLNESLERSSPQRIELARAQTGGPAVAKGSSLPGGASSLSETYGNWRVTCVQQGNGKRCALSQVQTQKNGQRVLAIELNAPAGNTISGTLILPFGLALDSGIAFQIGEKPAMQPIRFRTCLPAGCVVNVTFDASTVIALRTGTVPKVKAIADGGEAAPFSISLQGFGTALDRVGVLAR
jgi:invasion protein IalB